MMTNVMVAEEIVLDVPYRNQITDFPNWWNNWSSCGYTCMIMSLLHCEAVPAGMTEQNLIELMNEHCSTTADDGSKFYYWERSDEFCRDYLGQFDLKVRYVRDDFENKIKDELRQGNPVVVGTYIFGGCGHVILIVGYRDDKWIVHDPLNRWGQEMEPPNWWTEQAAYSEYPMGSFSYLYGVVIEREISHDYAGQITDQSPTATIYDQDMAMLWVRIKNTGKQEWKRESIHLGTINPNDNSCILQSKNHPESTRWVANNRIQMEQEKVESGGEALFGIPVMTNGLNKPVEISFRLVNDDENNSQWFGQVVSWTVDCRQNVNEENNQPGIDLQPCLASGQLFYHRGSVHNHTTWSDGCINVEGLCNQAKNSGLEYLVISDHSDYFDSAQKFQWYVEDINQSMKKIGICTVAGIEYSMQNYGGQVLPDTHNGRIHIIGFGYNRGKEIIVPPFFPWSEYGPKTTIKELVDWHYERGLPIIICHPGIRGNDGFSSRDLIGKYQFCDPTHISAMEIFDIGMDTTTISTIAGKLMWPMLEDLESLKLYQNHLFPAGVGVSACSDYHGVPTDIQKPEILGNEFHLTMDDQGNGMIDPGWGDKYKIKLNQKYMRIVQSMDRAKTSYVSGEKGVTIEEVIDGFKYKRTVAARYHETFDFLKINDQNWAPGVWQNKIECVQNVKIDFQIQFHNETGAQDKFKEVVIVRNGKTICDQIVEIDSADKLKFSLVDKNLSRGLYKYFIFVTGLELDDRAQERIITSPIEVNVIEKNYANEKPEVLTDGSTMVAVFGGLTHLGDSFYATPLNVGFSKQKDEGKVGSWFFDLDFTALHEYDQAVLTMTIRGAEKLDKQYYGNPISINGAQIGECLVENGKIENNGKYHYFVIPKELLLSGKNILMIRSMSHYIDNHGIDFDDFEIADIKLLFVQKGGVKFGNGGTLAAVLNDEQASFDVPEKDGFSQEEIDTSEKMQNEFVEKGGQVYPIDDPVYDQLDQIMEPIMKNIELFDRYQEDDFKMAIFKSATIDPIVLPDGTLLIPDGLLNLYNEDLPESFMFPILSQMIQADKGITFDQSKRTNWSKVLGTIGLVASHFTGVGGEIVQAVATGFLLAAVINLKVDRDDYFISDAYALDMLDQIEMDGDDAFSYVDAITTMQSKNPRKLAVFYLYAPDAKERMKALQYYHLLKNCYALPIKPNEIDWERVVEEKK